MPTIECDSNLKDIHGGCENRWRVTVSTDGKMIFKITTSPSDAPMWSVSLVKGGNIVWENLDEKKNEKSISKGDYFIKMTCPRGARYGDTISVEMTMVAGEVSETAVATARATQSILALRTQVGQEIAVADAIAARVMEIKKMDKEEAKKQGKEEDIYAMLSPDTLRGYLIVEGMNTERLQQKTKNIKKAKSFVEGESQLSDMEKYFKPVSPVVGIVEGDIVELITAPFKGEKARVRSINEKEETITVELIDAIVAIPVNVSGKNVKLIEKEK